MRRIGNEGCLEAASGLGYALLSRINERQVVLGIRLRARFAEAIERFFVAPLMSDNEPQIIPITMIGRLKLRRLGQRALRLGQLPLQVIAVAQIGQQLSISRLAL